MRCCCRQIQYSPQYCFKGEFRFLGSLNLTDLGECRVCSAGAFCEGMLSLPQQCPARTYNDQPAATALSWCKGCASGRYCVTGTGQPYDCPVGTWSPDASSVCVPCKAGRFCAVNATSETAMEANACGIGTYSTAGQAACTDCPAGTYANGAANDRCVDCPLGSFCPERSVAPLKCPAGTRRNGTRGSERQDCSDCELGTFGGTEGSARCEPCPEGMISAPGATSSSSCRFAILVDPQAIVVELSPEDASATRSLSVINTGVRNLHWKIHSVGLEPVWVTAPVNQGMVSPGNRTYVSLALDFGPQLAYSVTRSTEFHSTVGLSAGEGFEFNVSVTLKAKPGIVNASTCTIDGEHTQTVPAGSFGSWKLRTADKYGQLLRASTRGAVRVSVGCDLFAALGFVCAANPTCVQQIGCCTDNLDGSYSIQVSPSPGSVCGVVVYVNGESLADRYPRLVVEARATDECSSFNVTVGGARAGRQLVIRNNQRLGVEFPAAEKGRSLTLIPLKDAKMFNLSDDVTIDASSLAVGSYMIELPAVGSRPQCVLSNFALQCADGYETLNGEGVCYEISKAKLYIAVALSAVFVLFLAALFLWIYKKRHSVQELFVSVVKSEGMQGFSLGTEMLDLAGDAVVYHDVATRYRYMQGLFMAYTVAFPLACVASVIAIGLKLRAMHLQLQIRRRGFALAPPDRTVAATRVARAEVLQSRLDTCRKEQKQTYAAVLCAALEDLPMGALSIVLTSSLPAGEKLSIINQLSIAWSWLNLGGKILKATALPRLWSEEKDLKRKLGKHEAAAADPASDAAMQASIDPDADDQPRAPVPDGFLHAVRHFLRNLLSRKNARQGDAELELVHAFMIQAKAEGAAKKRANQPQAAVLSDAHQPASQPTVRGSRTHARTWRKLHTFATEVGL